MTREQVAYHLIARTLMRCETPDGCASDALQKDNCGACTLHGHGDHADGSGGFRAPNYAGWARVYIEARVQIPARYLEAFGHHLSRGDAYGRALRAYVQVFGVKFEENKGKTR